MSKVRSLAGVCLAMGFFHAEAAFAEEAGSYQNVSFYFAAHEDDWQLFMNPTAFKDVTKPKTKAVFVHMTAGDAGLGIGTGGRKYPYYLARENGAEAAVRFMADTDLPVDQSNSFVNLNGHSIYRVAYRNTVSYFFRVPDGNPGGTGYADTGYQSLKRLAAGLIPTLIAVDGSTVYHEWGDVVGTVRTLIDHERGRAPNVQLNVAEIDPKLNPGDHADHLATAKAALDAAKPLSCVTRAYYVDYASSKLPENLNPQQRDLESSVFAVTASGIRALDHYNAWHHYNEAYIGRNYFRREKGTAKCDAAPAVLTSLTALSAPGNQIIRKIQ